MGTRSLLSLERSHKQPPGCPTSPLKCHIPRLYRSTTHPEDQVASPTGAGRRCSCNKGMMFMNWTGSGCAHPALPSPPTSPALWKVPSRYLWGCRHVHGRSWKMGGMCLASQRLRVLLGWGAALLAAPHPNDGFTFGYSRLPSRTWQSPALDGTTGLNQEQLCMEEIFFSEG